MPRLVFDVEARFAQLLDGIDSANKKLGGMESVVKKASGALSGLISVGAVVAFTKSLIDQAAALDDMAEKTGATVEGLSRLQQIARIGGHEMDSITTAMTRLTKTLMGADEESKGAGKALKQLGLDMATLRTLAPDQAFELLAQKLSEFEDGAGKTSVAIAILGKAGAEYLPILKDIAENSSVTAKITAETAAEAERLQKAWGSLKNDAVNLAQSIVMDLVPAMKDFLDLAREVGAFDAFRAVGTQEWGSNIQERLRGIRTEIDGIEASADESIGLYLGPLQKARIADLKSLEEALKAVARQEALRGAGPKYRDEGGAAANKQSLAIVNSTDAIVKKTKQAANAWADFNEQVEKFVQKGMVEEFRKLEEAQEAHVAALRSYFGPMEKHLAALKEENDYAGLLESQIQDVAIARLEEARAIAILNGAQEGSLEGWEREIELRKQIRAEAETKENRDEDKDRVEASKQAAKAIQEDWKRASDAIGNSLTDALMRGFESGEDAGKVFADTMRNMFKTMVLRPLIQPIVQGAANSVLGAIGVGQQGSSVMDWLGLGSAVNSVTGGFSAGTLVGGGVAEVMTAAGATTGVATGVGSFVAQAVPYVALALAAYSIFAKKGGGPKTEMRGGELFDSPSRYAENSGLSEGVAQVKQMYADLSAEFGGTAREFAGQLRFGLDPRGDAPNQVQTQVRLDGGMSYWTYSERGRPDDAAEQTAEEFQRMLVAALRDTDLDDAIDAIFDAIDPASASINTLANALAKSKDIAEALADAEEASAKAAAEAAEELRKLAEIAEQEMAKLTESFASSLSVIGDTMMQTHNAFAQSIRTIRLGQLDTEGQYHFLDREAARVRDVLASLSDPALIGEYAGRLNDLTMQAFGLLGPEQQTAKAEEFITSLEKADALTQERLIAAADLQAQAAAAIPEAIVAGLQDGFARVAAIIIDALPKGIAVDVRVDTPALVEVGVA